MTDPADKPTPEPIPFHVVDRRGVEDPAPPPPEPQAPPANDDASPAAVPGPDVVVEFRVRRILTAAGALLVEVDFPKGQRDLLRSELIGMLAEALEVQRVEFGALVTASRLAEMSRLAIPAPTIAGLRGPRPPGR